MVAAAVCVRGRRCSVRACPLTVVFQQLFKDARTRIRFVWRRRNKIEKFNTVGQRLTLVYPAAVIHH